MIKSNCLYIFLISFISLLYCQNQKDCNNDFRVILPNEEEKYIKDDKIEYLTNKTNFLEKLKFWKNRETLVRYKFKKLSAIIPEELYFIIDSFNQQSLLLKRLILYGPPGNGKTILAKEIAKELKAGFIEIRGPSLVNQYQGSGAQAIEICFAKAMKFIEEKKKKVLIFIDEIDALAPIFTQDDRFHEHKAALQTLWLWLDKIKNMPELFVVFATNKFEHLDKAFITRFDGNVIELKNPGEIARKDIIEYYIKEFNSQIANPVEINAFLINDLVNKTDNFNIRSLEGIVRLIIERASRNKGQINNLIIKEAISKQKNIILIENKDQDNKLFYEKTNFALNTIGTSLGIITTGVTYYDRIYMYKKEKEFWNLILKLTSEMPGGQQIVDMVRNHQEAIGKLGGFINIQSLAFLGTLLLVKNSEKIKEIVSKKASVLPDKLWNGFKTNKTDKTNN